MVNVTKFIVNLDHQATFDNMTKHTLAYLLLLVGYMVSGQHTEIDSKSEQPNYKLVQKHFFDPHYDWQNHEINPLLELAAKKNQLRNVFIIGGTLTNLSVIGLFISPVAITIGSIIKGKSR